MSGALTSRIAAEFAATANGAAPAALQAIETLTARGLPTSRDENWKYVNLRTLEKVRFAPAGQPPTVHASDLPAAVANYARYVFVDGIYSPALSTPVEHAGVSVQSLGRSGANGTSASAHSHVSAAVTGSWSGDLRFALLNDAFATDGAAIRVAAGTDCPTCIELVFVATADARAAASYPRVDLQIEKGARVGFIERHVSIGSDANFINCAVSVQVARDAAVRHYRIQETGAHAIYFDTLTARLAENAKYHLHGVSLGAQSARSTVHIQLQGEHSEVGLFDVSVGGRAQVHDTFALVEHMAPNARTEQTFRGVSSARARVAFNGKIVVRKEAHGTDSRQSLRGLLAGADAEIDVRPQLEIYNDDVRCSHGATAGKLDDDMLFYLLSRGLDRETALRILKWAFLEDVVAKIDVPELRRQIEQSLAGQLNETAAVKEFR